MEELSEDVGRNLSIWKSPKIPGHSICSSI